MTEIERRLHTLLADMGFSVELEREFPPYRVDCYVPELHVAFEADGPLHGVKPEAKRDRVLAEDYGLVVYRIKQNKLLTIPVRTRTRVEILRRVDDWADTVEERKGAALV